MNGNLKEKLCDYGASAYYLFTDGSVRCGVNPETARMIYTVTPISRGYREFMPTDALFKAMKERGLIHD
jgi:hypothetical protein